MSQESSKQVEEIVKFLKPEVVLPFSYQYVVSPYFPCTYFYDEIVWFAVLYCRLSFWNCAWAVNKCFFM